jgi:maltose alpha-D-glucosyltransferase/alpha-amylase
LARFRRLVGRSLTSKRIRTHGDYHLGQVLYTGNDFLIIDFEGEPSRSLNERRLRRSPLRDVAGMLRSFDYAVHSALQEQRRSASRGLPSASSWGVSGRAGSAPSSGLHWIGDEGPPDGRRDEIELLLDVYVLEKAVYEMAYELNNRPDWLTVPLQGILELVQGDS